MHSSAPVQQRLLSRGQRGRSDGIRVPERDIPVLAAARRRLRSSPASPGRMTARRARRRYSAPTRPMFDRGSSAHAARRTMCSGRANSRVQRAVGATSSWPAMLRGDRPPPAHLRLVEISRSARKSRVLYHSSEGALQAAVRSMCSRGRSGDGGKRLIHGESVVSASGDGAHFGQRRREGAEIIQSRRSVFRPEAARHHWRDVEATVVGLPQYATRVPWVPVH